MLNFSSEIVTAQRMHNYKLNSAFDLFIVLYPYFVYMCNFNEMQITERPRKTMSMNSRATT